MAGQKEIFLGSLSTRPEIIPLSRLFEQGILPRNTVELQMFLGESLTKRGLAPENFSLVLQSAFGGKVKAREIPDAPFSVNGRDLYFADQFGYVIGRFGCARLVGERLEAWIGPALLHKDHPLASAKSENSAMFVVELRLNQPRKPSYSILPPEKITSAHYLRVTVKNESLVLYQVCSEIANRQINICELRQPEVEEGKPAEIAFILDPCTEEKINLAVSSIRNLPVCFSVDAVFAAVGHPTRDISLARSNSSLA